MFLNVHTLEYQTVKETAEAWGVTKRYVNLCIADGRVSGVMKMGNMWLVPSDAKKPAAGRGVKNPRQKMKLSENPLCSDLSDVLTEAFTPAPRDNPDSILDTCGERLRLIHECGLAYARGDFGRTIRCYEKAEGDEAVKLCACSLAIVAAISLGDYPLYLKLERYLKSVIQTNGCGEVSAFAELTLASAHLGAMAPNMVPVWLKDGDFTALPPQAKQDAAYKRAKYFQCLGKYESMLAVAQTALALGDSRPGFSFSDTYLRLICALSCYALDRADDAKRWLLDAMRLNLPHGFTTPFAELIPLFGGMVEQCLRQEFPALYGAVIEQWKRTYINWITFHNRFTKDNITLILSLREYEMAQLVARRVPYVKVAEQFHLSIGSLKNAIQIIYSKLYVNNRAELSKLILVEKSDFICAKSNFQNHCSAPMIEA